ncbi:glycerophosphodiester phosphodiesterase [Solibacillus sp. FSL H8-0538]|uniref:glycerophosphodiester phosphodiesterase n=1 Tax=Solibacillus sp. FSL H8-0538 TaxID=2921400 RepID=UPI0030FB504F
MKIYAHRGYSGRYPENTLAAFKAAARLPIHGVELDVHVTADQELVVIHDEAINRTSSGRGLVKDMTLQQLRAFDYGAWFHEDFAGEVIPTLAQVLDVFSGTPHQVNIELKSDVFVYAGLEQLVLREVEAHKMTERVVISSFDHEAVQRVGMLAPHVENAALFSTIVLDVAEYVKSIPAKAIHVSYHYALRKPVREAINAGCVIRVYTVNTLQRLNILREIGVDAIFTDEPEKMLSE